MKQILSMTHTIVAPNPEFDGASMDHPPGTLVEVADDEALRLVNLGLAVMWDPAEHGATPAEIAARFRNSRTAGVSASAARC